MKRFLLVILILNICYGCTGILDKGSRDQITPKSYWKNTSNMKLYINQLYPTFGSHLNYWGMDINSDNLQYISPSEALNGTRSVPSRGGGWNWSNIRKVNYFFVNANKVDKGSKREINQYKGEGHFFRAYFYFQKLKRFGAVPIYKKPLNINSEGLKAPRDPRQKVADFILSDLNKAIDLLQKKSQLPSNRLNKACALLLKSRVSLYEGTWEKYHAGTAFGVEGSDGTKYIKMAAEAARKLIDSGSFSIYSTGHPEKDYYKLFNRTDLSGNSEVLLWRVSDPGKGLGTSGLRFLNGTIGDKRGITKQLVDSYLSIDGKPIAKSPLYKGDTTLTQVVKNRDPRLKQTIWVPGMVQIDYASGPQIFDYPTLNEGSYNLSTTGYMIRKGSTTDPEQNAGTSSDRFGKTDGIVFRYAEALLNYAEAKAELGKITQGDLDKSVNLLRKRVGMPKLTIPVGFTDPNWNFPNLSPIINEIRRERRVELALEGFRYDDLMRWAAGDLIKGMKLKGARFIKGKSFPAIEDQISGIPVDKNRYIWRYENSVPSGFQFNEGRDYLYPIPTRALTLNKNLKQNPGWGE